MKIFFVTFASAFISLCAFAETIEKPGFTFTSASTAFNASAVPQASLLTGTWVLVGIATTPARPGQVEEYYPDGVFEEPELLGKGPHSVLSTIRPQSDAFNSAAFSVDYKVIRLKDGKIVRPVETRTAILNEEGLVGTLPATSDSCAEKVECKFFEPKGFLLCRNLVLDSRRFCREQVDSSLIVSFRAYIKKP